MSRQRFDPLHMPLDGLRLIEASAGTGKTFSLAGLYLRLLVEKRLSVRDILVITFTRAATQELRERLRERLANAARVARDPETADPRSAEDQSAEAVMAASDDNRDTIARHLTDAAHRMDEATIATIHGFSQRGAAENAFDSALPFDRGEPVDDAAVFEEVVADYWRARAVGASTVPGFSDLFRTPDKLDAALAHFRSRPHARFDGPKNREIGRFAQRVRQAWSQAAGAAFTDELRDCWATGALKKQSLKKEIEKLGGIDEALDLLKQRLESAYPVPILPAWTAHLTDPETQFKKSALGRGEALIKQALAQDLRRLRSLAHLSELRKARSQTGQTATSRKRDRRQFSFADMIAALYDAVADHDTGPRLSEALHDTWPWALVDEFQDTDPRQYEILRRVYTGRDSGGLILIGDPKQAIYGFRGGDVYTYLSAAADTGEKPYSLDTNHRSTRGLLHAVEALYRFPGNDAFLVNGIQYQPVRGGLKNERTLRLNGAALPPMTLWRMALANTNKGSAHDACRDICVARIRELLDPQKGATVHQHDGESGKRKKNPLAPRDIAVLVNTNTEASEMQRTLSATGIAAVCLHQASIFASREALDVLHLLKAAASPVDGGLIRAALASELMGCRLSDLTAMEDDEQRWQRELDRFQQAHERWRAFGVLSMIQPLIQDNAPRLLTYLDGERRMSNYLQIAELLAGAESETFAAAGLLRWLRQAIQQADGKQGSEAEQLRLESDEALVRITTVHKAKGLEYPVVFLPFAPWLGTMSEPHKPPYRFHNKKNQALIDVVGTVPNRDQAIREARAEGLRVLYVALTRAELSCFLPWGAANGTPNSALASLLHRRDDVRPSFWGSKSQKKPLTDELVRKRLEALAGQAPNAILIEPLPGAAKTIKRPPPPTPPLGRARTDLPTHRPPWSIYSFTRLVKAAEPGPAAAGAEDETEAAEPETEAHGEWLADLPGGTAFGTAVHAVLETADPEEWPPPGAPVPPSQRSEVAGTLRRFGVVLPGEGGAATLDRTAGMVQCALHTPLPGIGPLAEVPQSRRLPEMEFVLRLGGHTLEDMLNLLTSAGYAGDLRRERQTHLLQGLMHGFIDLVVEHNARYYVIDYKTNWLGPRADDYQPRSLENAIRQHHYDLQYLIYVTALHRYLHQTLDDYDPGRQLGGVFYLFLRGMAPEAGERGIFCDRPEPALIERLDALLDADEKAA